MWCAAASSGQEPYSLAMEIAERQRDLVGWNIEIVATDFSTAALRKARNGVYSQFEVQRGLPVSLLVKHFTKVVNGWEISPAMRSRVQFREHNLLAECETLGTFDVIFCRNVLIYFDDCTKREVLARRGATVKRWLSRPRRSGDNDGGEPGFRACAGRSPRHFALSPKAAAARAWLEEERSGSEATSARRDEGASQGRVRTGVALAGQKKNPGRGLGICNLENL
ncbi:MAG: CheR family methyltransferase [Methyloceanibacter sp.]|uniref:CheR family methyltransferase n=1 Tax=Methyloceanibacter sp. TaxID=1965321 RepID=UPI003D9B71FC